MNELFVSQLKFFLIFILHEIEFTYINFTIINFFKYYLYFKLDIYLFAFFVYIGFLV